MLSTSTPYPLTIDKGDTALMFISTALVQLMTPGLAFFYGGLVQHCGVLSILLYCLISMGVTLIIWFTVGFSLVFGEPIMILGHHVIGNPYTYLFFRNVDVYTPLLRDGAVLVPGFPGVLFAIYMGMFAIITPALITGALTGRVGFLTFAVFQTLWVLGVWCPVGCWTLGGGWMFQLGARDFAGGLVVHTASGFSALGAVLYMGKRAAYAQNPHAAKQPHNLPFVVLGTALLWFGWFGFNAGSAMVSGGLSAVAFANTHLAGSCGLFAWVLQDVVHLGKPKLAGACAGVVSGLVVVTPAAGFVQPVGALVIGILGSIVCRTAIMFVESVELDDATDVWAVHGVGGFLGTILTGLFADGQQCANKDTAPKWCVNPGGITFSWYIVGVQTFVACFAALYALVATVCILKFATHCTRSSNHSVDFTDDEELGELAYNLGGEQVGAAVVRSSTHSNHRFDVGWERPVPERGASFEELPLDDGSIEKDGSHTRSSFTRESPKAKEKWYQDASGEWLRPSKSSNSKSVPSTAT
jgi:Amt family ammonium transporter